jgi:CheY-like chemotaxis protein
VEFPVNLAGVEVLLVDDDHQTRQILSLMLSACGARVRAVASVGEALAACDEQAPDVILSDLMMPQRDGYALLRALRTASRCGDVPAIAITGLSHHRERALAAGFGDFILKPVALNVLCERVARQIGR